MARDALSRLVADAGSLPGAPGADLLAAAPRGLDRRQGRGKPQPDDPADAAALKTRVRELLFELARRVESDLGSTLERAHAWDQLDALRFIDRAVEDELAALRRTAVRLQAAEGDDAEERRALGLEAQLTLDAALGLTSLVERRLATLIRLRLRAGDEPDDRSLLPEGRPFLDLGAALHETARRWT